MTPVIILTCPWMSGFFPFQFGVCLQSLSRVCGSEVPSGRWEAAPPLGAHESASGEEFPERTGHPASAAESHSSHEVTRSSEERSPRDSVLHKEEKQLI